MVKQNLDHRIFPKLKKLFSERAEGSIQARLSQLCKEKGIPRGAAAEIMARQRNGTVWSWLDVNSQKCFRESRIEVKGKSDKIIKESKEKNVDVFKLPFSQFNVFPDLAKDCKIKKPYSKEINHSILILEEFIRNKLGLDGNTTGVRLVDEAKTRGIFNRKSKGESEGLHFLFRSAFLWLRNSGGHARRGATKEDCLQIVLFTDYLIRLFSDLYDKKIK